MSKGNNMLASLLGVGIEGTAGVFKTIVDVNRKVGFPLVQRGVKEFNVATGWMDRDEAEWEMMMINKSLEPFGEFFDDLE